jgi:hypothetical protein
MRHRLQDENRPNTSELMHERSVVHGCADLVGVLVVLLQGTETRRRTSREGRRLTQHLGHREMRVAADAIDENSHLARYGIKRTTPT